MTRLMGRFFVTDMDTHNPSPWPDLEGGVVYNRRIWTRDIADVGDGAESAMHCMIAVDKEKGEIRSKIVFRDCNGDTHYEFWVTRRLAHVDKAMKTLHRIDKELDDFIAAFGKAAEELENQGKLE